MSKWYSASARDEMFPAGTYPVGTYFLIKTGNRPADQLWKTVNAEDHHLLIAYTAAETGKIYVDPELEYNSPIGEGAAWNNEVSIMPLEGYSKELALTALKLACGATEVIKDG